MNGDHLQDIPDSSGKTIPLGSNTERYNYGKELIFPPQESDIVHHSQYSEDGEIPYSELEELFNRTSQPFSGQSLCRDETTLDLAPDPVSSNPSPICVGTDGFTASSNLNPCVKLSPLSQTQSSGERYSSDSLSMKNNYYNRRFIDSEIMDKVLDKDGITTCFQCKSCSKVFKKIETLRQHYITHTDRFSCPHCTTRCKSRGDLNRHIQSHTKDKPYHCDVCNTCYARESILKKHKGTLLHLRACYELENFAKGCKNTLEENQQDLGDINEEKLNHDGFSCFECPKVSPVYSEHIKHVRSHAMKHICEICNKGCKSSSLLRVHRRMHNRSSSLFCKLCSRYFGNFYSWKEHVKSHKSNRSSRLTKVAGRNHVNLHLSIDPSFGTNHESVQEFQCNKCQKFFFSRSHLRKHKCHHEETFVCGTCYRTFPSLAILKIHMRFHKEISDCQNSSFTSTDDQAMKRHDSGGSGFVCKLCYNRYDTVVSLNLHMKDHTPTMLFSGQSLDTSPLDMIDRTWMRTSSPGTLTPNRIKAELSNDSEEIKLPDLSDNIEYTGPPSSEKVEVKQERAGTSKDSDDDSILASEDFYEILNTALDGSDDDLNDSEISDSDEEHYSDINSFLKNEAVVSSESIKNEPDLLSHLKEPLFYENGDILQKYHAEFEMYSQIDAENHSFRCTLCDLVFREEKFLKNHLKRHVCEHCNQFFSNKEELAAHKSMHVGQLLKLIKTEAKRLHIPKQKWKGYLMVKSDSENELEDETNIEIAENNDSVSVQSESSEYLPQTLSHNKVVGRNKCSFKKYSYVDLDQNIFACTICDRRYARPTTLTKHLITHVCKFCNKFFRDKSELHEHKESHKNKIVHVKPITKKRLRAKIPSSPVSELNPNLLVRYAFVDANKQVFRCNVCQKNFVRKSVLKRHLKTHVCSLCGKFFEEKRDLAQHLTFHQESMQCMEDSVADTNELFEDIEDEAQFSKTSPLVKCVSYKRKKGTRSIKSKHIISSLPPWPQDNSRESSRDTEKSVSSEDKEKAVSSIDEGKAVFPVLLLPSSSNKVRPYPNNNPTFYQVNSQPVHIVKNTAYEQLSVASTSHQKSTSNDTIQRPLDCTSPEERERPYECNECGKKFLKSGHLKGHMMIHSGDKPFVCSMCDKAFNRSSVLKKHMMTHQKQCKVCRAFLTSKELLVIHMEVHKTNLLNA